MKFNLFALILLASTILMAASADVLAILDKIGNKLPSIKGPGKNP